MCAILWVHLWNNITYSCSSTTGAKGRRAINWQEQYNSVISGVEELSTGHHGSKWGMPSQEWLGMGKD